MLYRPKAITLSELVTVVAIIGVITAVAMLSMAVLPSRRLRAEARRVVSDLNWAREMAAASHNNYCVRFQSRSYEIYRGSCGGTALTTDTLQVDITNPSPPFNIVFNGFNSADLGGVADNDYTITLTQAGRTRNVYVYQNTGYAEMEE
jgi:Tfp pilus assembly protein FimT